MGDGAFPEARAFAEPVEGRLPEGFWFGSDLKTCWKSVYASYGLDRLRREEDELWSERDRLATVGSQDRAAVRSVLLRIVLVEDRLREIVGSYS